MGYSARRGFTSGNMKATGAQRQAAVQQHIAYSRRALPERVVRRQVVFIHRVQNPTVYRLQSVPHVRQSAAYNYAHCILYIGFLHFRHQRRFHDLLVRKADFFGVVLRFLSHLLQFLLCLRG